MTTFGGGGGGGRKSLTSARGLLALLEEPLDALKIHGLRCLNDCAMTAQWAEVAASLDVIESMHEDELFSRRDLAALVASKVGGDEFVCFYYRRHHHHLSVLVLRGERLILENEIWISFFFPQNTPRRCGVLFITHNNKDGWMQKSVSKNFLWPSQHV